MIRAGNLASRRVFFSLLRFAGGGRGFLFSTKMALTHKTFTVETVDLLGGFLQSWSEDYFSVSA
jgi:hypothetical protein